MNCCTKEELIAFEQWTVETFNAGKLKSPIHLSGGNEEQLIEIFKEIKPEDWVFTTYRSHYHALLKGVPEQRLKDWILDNKSIHFMDSEYQIISSAIVGGCLPIALGTALAITINESQMRKKLGDQNGILKFKREPHVWCFVGDMTASLGLFQDCLNYAFNHALPMTFVIENNELSTDTLTADVWGLSQREMDIKLENMSRLHPHFVKYYKYKRTFPHYGTGKFIASIWKDILDKEDIRGKGF